MEARCASRCFWRKIDQAADTTSDANSNKLNSTTTVCVLDSHQHRHTSMYCPCKLESSECSQPDRRPGSDSNGHVAKISVEHLSSCVRCRPRNQLAGSAATQNGVARNAPRCLPNHFDGDVPTWIGSFWRNSPLWAGFWPSLLS